MKKCLTVLLVIAVMFTFSFGSAFAATDPDTVDQLKAYAAEQAQQYYSMLETEGQTYLGSLDFDVDDYLIEGAGDDYVHSDFKGIVSKGLIETAVSNFVVNAKTAFSEAIAKIDYDANDTEAKVLSAVKTAYDNIVATYTDENILKNQWLNNFLSDQLKLDQDAALAVVSGYDPADYSNDIDEWSITVEPNKEVADGSNYTFQTATGLTETKTLTAREYVTSVIDTLTVAVSTEATGGDSGKVKRINAIRTAASIAEDILKGHKRTASEDYYIEAVPTSAELEADTSVDEAKASAITKMKAALAYKQIELLDDLQDKIDDLNEKASLTSTERKTLASLNKAKSELAAQFAAAEEVFTARINYCDTTSAVKALLGSDAVSDTILYEIDRYNVDSDDLASDTNASLDRYIELTDWVDDINDEAALRSEQKDVNGQPYYDADVLAENLAAAVRYLYTDNEGAGNATYSGALAKLDTGMEAALINAKIEYIKFITGESTKLVPLDSKGKKVTTVWNKATASASVSGTVDVFGGATYAAKSTKMYDTAQKEALTTLVNETKAAIQSAASIADIKTIFAEAHDKYTAIPTTTDHYNDWKAAGKIGLAYKAADYDAELIAYANYFLKKAEELSTKNNYPTTLRTAEGILTEVAYPVMYEAYTAEELADKVTEAKAAIDSIMTTKEINAEKTNVEAMIEALPKTIALTDKDAITAAADARDDYMDIPGATTPVNNTVLDNAIKAYEKLAAEELDDAFKALDDKKITTGDEAAVEALRALYDAYDAFCESYYDDLSGKPKRTATTIDTPATKGIYDATSVQKIEGELSDAKVAAVIELMVKLPVNPTAAERAQVEAARAAYEALSLEEKARIVETLAYDNLIDAEEYLGISSDDFVKAYLQDLSIVARSVKTASGNIKVTINADVQPILDAGYTVEYKFYRSTKPRSNYGTARMIKTENVYTNTTGTKGVRYYYKAMIQVKDADGNIVATTPLSQCKYACRVK